MPTIQSLHAKGYIKIKSTSTIPLNGTVPLGYRIGQTDRVIGSTATGHTNGFVVLNRSTGNAFIVSGGLWASTTFPADLLDAWEATIVGVPQYGYRIGKSDRTVGSAATEANGFIVYNSTNKKVFQVSAGLWADVTGSFSAATLTNIIAAWTNA